MSWLKGPQNSDGGVFLERAGLPGPARVKAGALAATGPPALWPRGCGNPSRRGPREGGHLSAAPTPMPSLEWPASFLESLLVHLIQAVAPGRQEEEGERGGWGGLLCPAGWHLGREADGARPTSPQCCRAGGRSLCPTAGPQGVCVPWRVELESCHGVSVTHWGLQAETALSRKSLS